MSWITKLQERWKVASAYQVILILAVFALTGTTVALVAKPLLRAVFQPEPVPVWATVLYYVVILPVYNILLLLYGFVFGQFQFFWDFEKRYLRRIFGNKKKPRP